MDNPQKLVAGSACTGMRGLDRGVERALTALRYGDCNQNLEKRYEDYPRSLKHAFMVEIEAVAAINLAAEMEAGVVAPCPVWTDVKTMPWEIFAGRLHLFMGGYPCVGESSAGQQLGTSDPRWLWPDFERGVDTIRPVLCFFENVANHLNISYRHVRESLQRLGYKVEEGIFAAQQVGAPHLRKRLFIMAVANTYCDEQSKRRGDLRKMLGIPEEQRQSKYSAVVSGGDSQELEYTSGNSDQRGLRNVCESDGEVIKSEEQREDRTIDNRDASSDVGNSECQRSQGRDQFRESAESAESDSELEHTTGSGLQQRGVCVGVEQGDPDITDPGKVMDHPIGPRLEGFGRHGNAKTRWQNTVRSIAETSLWPAGQGTYQHEWEEPRLESKMGTTIDGHDFSEDLLRLAGNAVVEQQAELAFRTLIMKFL